MIKEIYALIEPHAEKSIAYFYGRLFAENPRLRTFFPSSMAAQRRRMSDALSQITASSDNPETFTRLLSRLGREHRKFGIAPAHYDAMGRATLATLRAYAGESWTAEMEAAWTTMFDTAAAIMIQAAEDDAAQAPPWWVGEVVEHDRRTPDIAVLTVRPNEPLPYRAGQYVSVQTARWPRVWRTYSIANAPAEDGLLRFHVRALPAGWVSGALVRHTRAGDALLLGRASGGMVLDAESGRDVLCVAGGTGLGPLKALAEEALRTREDRDVHLLFGARTPADLYDLRALRALAEARPRFHVVPVVSEGPAFGGVRGPVSDVLDRFQDWTGHDVYVAGPPGMVSRTVMNLQELGVPTERIHYDPADR
ncbi:globin domain-containing protein [Actinoallomurus spadix]|uniref:globin domain-containing protein n=1 Tax=Actinoallomurus spadix TaxID=79912 RepID=UPI00209234F2|nr:globin domain-containing protein [Actinoallomurus spadix]MCO5989860.1 globin domain-containing protein [Actinoallomurus spadix]